MRRIIVVTALLVILTLALSSPSYAYKFGDKGDRTKGSTGCTSCHKGGNDGERNPDQDTIPHGSYTTTSDHCSTCHDVHVSNSARLLPGVTLSQTCNYCHDFTGAKYGVYRLNGADLLPPASGHRVVGVGYADFDGTLEIPGGNDSDGGVAALVYKGDGKLGGGVLSCDSCHSPHGVNVVNRYIGESDRNYGTSKFENGWIFPSSRILRNKIYGPNEESPTLVQDYGAAWCAACHQGRDDNNESVHNHPVDMANVWGWGNTTIILDKGLTPANDPRKNNVFVMREDLETVDGAVYYETPMCQQCHASARDVTKSFGTLQQQYRNFPHQSINRKLLVEQYDNLCLNCHTPQDLP